MRLEERLRCDGLYEVLHDVVGVHKLQDKLITGMLDNGYTREFAERTFKQLEGFGS